MSSSPMSFSLLLGLGLVFGLGFGFFVQRAGLCIAAGLVEIFLGRGRRILRMLTLIFAITSVGFLTSSYMHPDLGLKPIGQIRGYGFYNILGGILFGAGITLSGGCILGTLRQIGEGNLTFVVVMLAFAPGMALVVHVINPLLAHGYDPQRIVLPTLTGIPAPYLTAVLASAALLGLHRLRRRSRSGRPAAQDASSQTPRAPLPQPFSKTAEVSSNPEGPEGDGVRRAG